MTAILIIYLLRGFEWKLHQRRAPRYQLAVAAVQGGGLVRVRSLMNIYQRGIIDLRVTPAETEEDGATIGFRFVGSDDERYDFLKLVYEIPGVSIVRSDHE